MSKYNTDLDYVIKYIDISIEELEEIKAEADKIISENKGKKDKESRKILALAYLKKAQCRRRLEANTGRSEILYENTGMGLSKKVKRSIKKLLKKALELSHDMPEALMQLGIINNNCLSYKEYKIINFYDMAIQIKPDYAAALNNRAMCFRSLSLDNDEFSYIENQEERDKLEKERFKKNKSKLKNAVADLTEAIKIRPFDALYYLNRGVFHSKLEEHKEAVEDFSNALNYASDVLKERFITGEGILKLRGNNYTELKEYGKAIDDFSEYLRLEPEYNDETLLMRAKAYYLAGEKVKAKADIDKYLNRKRREADENKREEIIRITGVTQEEVFK